MPTHQLPPARLVAVEVEAAVEAAATSPHTLMPTVQLLVAGDIAEAPRCLPHHCTHKQMVGSLDIEKVSCVTSLDSLDKEVIKQQY